MTKLPLILDDETRPIWNAALRARDEVAAWPDWKHTEQPKDPMAVNYDPALHDLAIQTAITVDLRPMPLIDVGPCPDSSDATLVGQPALDRLPYVRPAIVLPDLETATEDDVSDLAANCALDTETGRDDLWVLVGSQEHVRAICQQLGATELALAERDERIANLSATAAALTRQLAVQQSIGTEYQRKFERSDSALAHTAQELYAERNKVVEMDVMLRTERQRLEREATMHHETMNRLIKQAAESCKLTRALETTEALRVAALEGCEQMRAININLSEEIVTTRLAMAQLAQTLHEVRAGRRQ